MKERIDTLLVERGLCESRAKAQARVLAGEVVVDDQRVDKPGTKVDVHAAIRLKGDALPFVSRGGVKLAGALERFGVRVEGRVCADIGASTGGFTDVLLQRGAVRVYAIDVGRGQLHEKLRQDPRVVNLERTHVTKMSAGALQPQPDLAVIDVSFISLELVLPAALAQLTPSCELVTLVKPQFEVGRAEVGKGGIVKSETARKSALERIKQSARALGLAVKGEMESPITGADGNVEYLLHLLR